MLTFITAATAATATTGEAADEASAPTRQRQVRHLATEIYTPTNTLSLHDALPI